MKLKTMTKTELFSESQLAELLQSSLKVFKEVPFRVQGTSEFFDSLTDYGCRVNGESVYFPQQVIDRVLARISEEKQKWTAHQGSKRNDWAESELCMFTHGQALHICDIETNSLRSATTADLVKWCHVVDSFGDLERMHPTFIPQDVPVESADFHTFATIILNSRKPHRVSVYSAKMIPFFIEACRIVDGSLEKVKKNPVFNVTCYINSPFMISRECIDIGMEARRLLDIPITFGQMPVVGGAGPVTIAGSLIQNTAESLAICAMRLAIDNKLHPITPPTTAIDMKHLSHRQSGPDLLLHFIAGAEMNAFLFGEKPAIPFLGISAQTVSPQSVYEKALSAGFNTAMGQRNLGVGSLAYSDIGSPVQLVLDYEMGLYFRHIFRDVSVDKDHIGLEPILETAPSGAYFLETDHTAKFFREESWLPAFIDPRPPLVWMQNPTDMIDKARKQAKELNEKTENMCPLTEDKKQQIKALIKEAINALD